MTVHKKLMQARIKLHSMDLKKSGENKYAGYKYFELSDFLPSIQYIFDNLGLCGIVSFEQDIARLCITDTEDNSVVVITSPMSTAALKGCHEVQNLGAVQTYLRRYLWVTALEIVEHDAIDSSEPVKPVKAPEPVKIEKVTPAPTGKAPVKIAGRDGSWQIKVTTESENNLEAWLKIVMDSARLSLSAAQSQKDVMDIFKVNRNIFDKLKQESQEDHELLMSEFKLAKDKFGETK